MGKPEDALALLRSLTDEEAAALIELASPHRDNIIGYAADDFRKLARSLKRAYDLFQVFQEAKPDFRDAASAIRRRISKIIDELAAHKAKPRHADRDREIARLRDEEKLSWGQIARTIRGSQQWETSQKGAKISAALVKQAYRRFKAPKKDLEATKQILDSLLMLLEILLADPFNPAAVQQHIHNMARALLGTDEIVPSTNEFVLGTDEIAPSSLERME